uniref:Vacuole membrane protein KMS1-like n=1 Tax=Nelumbo nucifera TaxID=4432 RepID=A0A822XHS6_NELNU|nr:TPA_asm: hypothetical protein HUJ06_020975 [Nelumbo nucifera]
MGLQSLHLHMVQGFHWAAYYHKFSWRLFCGALELHLENFLLILSQGQVPNPLFDLAGIMCGQFGIPVWKFFLATLTGKAIIKTHIQTVFVISVCNNQLLEWIENELIWVLGHVPGLSFILPSIVAKLHSVKEKYITPPPPVHSTVKVKKWNLSFASIWNTVVWFMLLNFFVKIVTATAQKFCKKQQEKELAALTDQLSKSRHLNGESGRVSN